jgi:hypothetical protein
VLGGNDESLNFWTPSGPAGDAGAALPRAQVAHTEATPLAMLAPALRPLAERLLPDRVMIDCGGNGRCGPLSLAYLLRKLGLFSEDDCQLRQEVVDHARKVVAENGGAGLVWDLPCRDGDEPLTIVHVLQASILTWPPRLLQGRSATVETWLDLMAETRCWVDKGFLLLAADLYNVAICFHGVADGQQAAIVGHLLTGRGGSCA